MEKILYQSGSVMAEGLLLAENREEKRPALIFAHAWMGRDSFIEQKLQLAKELGVVGFAMDNYGGGTVVDDAEKASALMLPLFINRHELQKRVRSAFDTVSVLPFVDPNRMAIIGFCFGGLAAMELLFSGAPIKGAISFHGIYEDTLHGQRAILEPTAQNIQGKALLLHGYNDPMNPPSSVTSFQKKLNDASLNWRFVTFGNTYHAFTNEKANDLKNGLKYNSEASTFGFQIAKNFLQEIFS